MRTSESLRVVAAVVTLAAGSQLATARQTAQGTGHAGTVVIKRREASKSDAGRDIEESSREESRRAAALAASAEALARGMEFLSADKYAEAESSYREAILLAPESAAAHQALGDILSVEGKTAEALASYRRARELDPDLPGIDAAIRGAATVEKIEKAEARRVANETEEPAAEAPATPAPKRAKGGRWRGVLRRLPRP